jgi:hypothetical protein
MMMPGLFVSGTPQDPDSPRKGRGRWFLLDEFVRKMAGWTDGMERTSAAPGSLARGQRRAFYKGCEQLAINLKA